MANKMFSKNKLTKAGGLLVGGAAVTIASKLVDNILPNMNDKLKASVPGVVGFLLMEENDKSFISSVGSGMIGATGEKIANSFGLGDIVEGIEDITFEETVEDDVEDDIDEDVEDDIDEDVEEDVEDYVEDDE